MDLYRQLENRFDGFITTGPVPMQTIRKSVPDCKPLSFFLCSDSNYYKMLFEVIYKYQDWNFEYWYFDFCDYLCPDQESSLVEYLKNGTFGEWLEKNNRYMEDMSVEDMMESTKRKLEKHIRLWNSGKIKYSLSRMSPIMPQILEAGVNCYYINFSLEDIETCFRKLTHEILVNRLRDTQPAAIDIVLAPDPAGVALSIPELQKRYELLERLINAYSKRNLCDFIVREIHLGFRISTDYRMVEKITDSFTSCLLKEYIRETGGFDVCVGYGMGADLPQAETAAAAAARESRISTDQASYLLNTRSERIRLSGRGHDFTVSDAVTPYIRELSDRSGLSTLTPSNIPV